MEGWSRKYDFSPLSGSGAEASRPRGRRVPPPKFVTHSWQRGTEGTEPAATRVPAGETGPGSPRPRARCQDPEDALPGAGEAARLSLPSPLAISSLQSHGQQGWLLEGLVQIA